MSIPGSSSALFLAAAAAGAGGYQVQRSLRFNSSDSGFLSRTPASAGNRKTWTWAGWVKRSKLSSNMPIFGTDYLGASYCTLYFDSNNTFFFENYSGGFQARLQTTQVFRDLSAWFHIVVALDTTQATAANRARIYVNGSEVTALTIATYPSQNTDLLINNNQYHEISQSNSTYTFGGYLADIHFIDGQALTPSSFTEVSATTGQLIPKQYTGSFGTNGFWLKFSDNSAATATTLGKDYSGNSNNWTPNNLSVTAGAGNDSLVDTPSSAGTDSGLGGQVTGNYATLNPLVYASGATFSNGNLEATFSASDVVGTHLLDTGKYYWEITCGTITISPSVDAYYGLIQPYSYSGARNWSAANVRTWRNGGTLYGNGSTGTVTSYTTGDVLGFAYDGSTGNLYVAKNGTWQNSANPASGTGAVFTGIAANTFVPGFSVNASSSITANFGQRAFAYTAPSGFKALCDTNLPAPVVAKPNTVMDVLVFAATNANNTSITGLNFQPDLVWGKSRTNAYSHQLYDSVRGVNKNLKSNTTGAEVTDTVGLTSFDSNGFTAGVDFNVILGSGSSVAWCWDAGTSTVTNTQGSITSSVRANASAGFSIVTYTGTGANASVGHGLGVAPSLIIIKARTQAVARNWAVYHSSIGATKILELSTTNAAQTVNFWQDTAPTSTVFTLSSQGDVNASTYNYVAYCFAPVTGYSAMGSYVGNSSADGPFVYTGFRPRFVMIKNADAITDWVIVDTARETYNVVDDFLRPNSSAAEGTRANLAIDILSNGFKQRGLDNFMNGSNTHIYAAFAESPFQFSRAR